jgi:hypothetical protein
MQLSRRTGHVSRLLVTGCRDHMVVTRHACQVWDVRPNPPSMVAKVC